MYNLKKTSFKFRGSYFFEHFFPSSLKKKSLPRFYFLSFNAEIKEIFDILGKKYEKG